MNSSARFLTIPNSDSPCLLDCKVCEMQALMAAVADSVIDEPSIGIRPATVHGHLRTWPRFRLQSSRIPERLLPSSLWVAERGNVGMSLEISQDTDEVDLDVNWQVTDLEYFLVISMLLVCSSSSLSFVHSFSALTILLVGHAFDKSRHWACADLSSLL